MGKITLLKQLRACAESAKNFTNGLVAELAQSVTDAMEELERLKADRSSFTKVTIPAEGWAEDDSVTAYPVYYDIPAQGITAKDRASVAIAPGSLGHAAACSMCPTCETLAGVIRIRAGSAPKEAISAEYWIDQGKE